MGFTRDIDINKKIPVSLVTTVYNEEKALTGFLNSIIAMSVLPQEIIIVDGGSKDATISILDGFKQKYQQAIKIEIIIDPTCTIFHTPAPIAKGRNIAIGHCSYEIIVVTDAGCIVDPLWLEEISKPFFEKPEIQFVAGWYEPLAKTYFEECQALATFQSLKAMNPKHFLPSSRSVAFTKIIWKEVGGYPELALGGEDTLFDMNVRVKTKNIVFAPKAIVYWRLRPTFKIFMTLVYRYGFGDGYSHILIQNLFKNTIKLSLAVILLVLGMYRNFAWLGILVVYMWLLPFTGNYREAFRFKKILKYPTVSFLKIVANTSYLIGYLKGSFAKNHPRFEKINDHQHQ